MRTAVRKSVTNRTILASITFAAAATATLWSSTGAAEVTVMKGNDWEFYTTGRINGFASYGFGDANPIASPLDPNEQIVRGGGLDVGVDSMPKMDANGNVVQGTFQSMRIRSGFVPNVLSFGLRRKLTDYTTMTVHVSIWATIDSEAQRKTRQIDLSGQEGWVSVGGPWGTVLVGRALDLFSRGATQNDFLYLHGYGVGFAGNIDSHGPTSGFLGYGVLAAFFSPGITYATPSSFPLQLTVGVYDPTPLPGGYEATRYVRPEAELTYDLERGPFKMHLFGNGQYQNVYRTGLNDSVNSYGVGYGGRFEVGPVHLGLAGHWGKGLGLFYALASDQVSVSNSFELRTFDGYSAIAQYAFGHFDLNAGFGISRVFLLDSDKDPVANPLSTQTSVFKYQVGYAAAFVYHIRDYLHFDLDVFRGDARWFGAPSVLNAGGSAEKQTYTFVNTGLIATW